MLPMTDTALRPLSTGIFFCRRITPSPTPPRKGEGLESPLPLAGRGWGRGFSRTGQSLLTIVALALLPTAHAQAPQGNDVQLETVKVTASADASAQGLSKPYAGGQVARGGRAGILGTRDNLETPFAITAYTNALIQDKQAKSVGDVLQSDPGVRVARGFGNFQESYFIRGFLLGSDDVAYNGLYSLLPRQYIATELFERVEVLRGASAFLTGANPGGGGLGGAINLLPKRAPNTPLTRVTLNGGSGSQGGAAVDVARRFGAGDAFGTRLNAAYRAGGTAIDDEDAKLGLVSLGLDWKSDKARLSGDLGYQDNQLDQTRTNIQLGPAVTRVPEEPDGSRNYAQPWSYSDERDLFGTLRGEYDLGRNLTAWAAYGLRRSEEANSLANLTVTNADSGEANTSRFDNTREDRVDTGELGLRGKLATGAVSHELVFAASLFRAERDNAFAFDFFNTQATNLYRPTSSPRPAFSANTFYGNTLEDPRLTNRTTLTSYAIGDTMGFMGERVLVTLGLRRQQIEVENFAYTSGTPDPAYDQSRTSPSVGAVWRLGKKLSLYGNYIEGLTQGDTAPAQATATPGKVLAPYVSRQKEVGLKFDLGKLGGGVALFTTTRPRAVVNARAEFVAEGQDRHQGIELNAYGVAGQGLRVLGGLTYLDAQQKATGNPATTGRQVIGVPNLQGSFGVEWDAPLARELTLDARVVHTGDSHYDDANTLEVPGFTRLDLGARTAVKVGTQTLTLRARIDNATDEDYYASVGGFPGIGYLVVGGPRSFSLSAAVDF